MRNIWLIVSGYILLIFQMIYSLIAIRTQNVPLTLPPYKYVYFAAMIIILSWCFVHMKDGYFIREFIPGVVLFWCGIIGSIIFVLCSMDDVYILSGYALTAFIISCFEIAVFYVEIAPMSKDLESYNVVYMPVFENIIPYVNILASIVLVALSFLKFRPSIIMVIMIALYLLHIVFLLMYSMISHAIQIIIENEKPDEIMDNNNFGG